MQRIKDNFNPYIPLSTKGYNKSLGWIILWSWLLGIPALILEKNGAEVDILALIVAIIIGGSQYMLFIFTIKTVQINEYSNHLGNSYVYYTSSSIMFYSSRVK